MVGRTHQLYSILTSVALGSLIGATASAAGLPGIGGALNRTPLNRIQSALQTVQELPEVKSLLQNHGHDLTVDSVVEAGELRTVKLQHYFKGVEVIGSMAFHHAGPSPLNRMAGAEAVARSAMARFDLSVEPELTLEDASALALRFADATLVEEPSLKILPSDDGSARLIFWVTVETQSRANELDGLRDVLIDAHSGEIIAEVSRQMTIAAVDVYSAENMPEEDIDPRTGAPVRLRFSKMERVVHSHRVLRGADAAARRAAENATRTLHYYQDRFNRDSYDGNGGRVRNIVHIGRDFANAFWSSTHKVMAYGDGDGRRTGDFTRGLDVAGHEMTHGVVSEAVQSGSVKGLMYFGESGALNEAYADFFGKMIEGEGSWVLGSDLFLDKSRAQRGIRNIADPNSLNVTYRDDEGNLQVNPFPDHMDERFIASGTCRRTNDYCWVHINSTIWSHAAYRIYHRIGRERTETLFYTTLNHFLTPRSGFRYARRATLYACSLLYGDGVCDDVEDAFEEVGL